MPSLKVTMEDNRQKETPREQNQRLWRAMDRGVSQKKQKQSKAWNFFHCLGRRSFLFLPGKIPYSCGQREKHLPTMQETRVRSWVGKIPWRRKWQPNPVLLPGKSHGRRSLVGYSPWGCKESGVTKHSTHTAGHTADAWNIIPLVLPH